MLKAISQDKYRFDAQCNNFLKIWAGSE